MRQSNYPRGRVFGTPPPEFETKPFRLSSDELAGVTSRSIPLSVRWFWLFAAIYFGFAIDFFEHLGQQAAREYRPIFVLVGIWALDWALGSYKLRRRFRKFFDDPIERFVLDSDRVVTAKSDGLRSRHSSGGEAFYPWQTVKSISTSGKFLTVTVAGGLMFLIPKDAFVNETDFKAIVSFAADNGLSGKQRGK